MVEAYKLNLPTGEGSDRYGMNGMTDLITMTHMEEHLTLHLPAGGSKLTSCLHNQLYYLVN